MRPLSSEPINLQHNPLTRQLLTALLVVSVMLLITSSGLIFNTRKDSKLYYNTDNGKIDITSDNIDSVDFFNGSEWIFVPNISASAIHNGAFVYDSYRNYPYADRVSISASAGWNELGDKATWHNADSAPEFRTYSQDGVTYYSALYMANLVLPEDTHDIRFSAPKINGYADLFCNGQFIESIGYDDSKSSWNLSGTYNDINLTVDANNELKIIVAVRSNVHLYAPGMSSYPQFSTRTIESQDTIISAIWLVITVVTMLLTLIGGFIISGTFRSRAKLYYFLAIQFCYFMYFLFDCNFIIVDSLARLIIRYTFEMLSAVLVYAFISSMFANDAVVKKVMILRYDKYIVGGVAIIMLISLYINKSLFASSFSKFSLFLFTSSVCIVSVLNILFFYIEYKNAVIALSTALVAFFCFTNMQFEAMTIYNVPTYSVYVIAAILALDVMFILRYNHQYKELENLSRHLTAIVNEKTLHISEINRDLIATNKRLLDNEEARKNILSNVSHDLRTPITAIRGYAELMKATSSSMTEDQFNNYLNNIIKRSSQMENIVSDIVELTKMESGSTEFVFIDLSLSEMLFEQKNLFSSELSATGKKLHIKVPEDDLLIVKVDAKRFARVIQNLISNAINYTKEDGEIYIKAWRSGDELPMSQHKIYIDISDNGIGIPEDAIPHIFDRFYRASNSGKNIKGTGLGLSIVQTILEKHGATISVTSTINKGTTFHIVMPAI